MDDLATGSRGSFVRDVAKSTSPEETPPVSESKTGHALGKQAARFATNFGVQRRAEVPSAAQERTKSLADVLRIDSDAPR